MRNRNHRDVFVCWLTGFSLLFCSAAGWSENMADPRSLVVMMKFRDGTGKISKGAGIIVDQNEDRTLIVTAGHNLRDDLDNLHTDFSVVFFTAPEKSIPAEPLPVVISNYDFGLVQVNASDAGDILGTAAPSEILGRDSILSDSEKAFIVGYGGGVKWKHNLKPEPVRKESVSSLVIASKTQLPGQSGGGVFSQDWSLIGMIYEVEADKARALPISLILDELRNSQYSVRLKSDPLAIQKQARRKLVDRNISWSSAAIADALSAVDVEVLHLFSEAGVESSKILEALGTVSSEGTPVAQVFFERSVNKGEAIRWLQAALEMGLNPNAPIKGEYYKSEGLLIAAIRGGNAAAVMELVKAGASPHAYQDLWFTTYPVTRFLLPLVSILNNESFSAEEKKEIMELFLEKGAVVPDLAEVNLTTYQTQSIEKLLEEAKQIINVDVKPSPSLCERPRTPICEKAPKHGFNWCAFTETMPKRIYLEMNQKGYHFYDLRILGFINAQARKGYYLALATKAHYAGPALVEVFSEGKKWRLYRYMSPGAGMGHCRKGDEGREYDDCWRRISMSYDEKNKEMMVEDYYPYVVSMACGGDG